MLHKVKLAMIPHKISISIILNPFLFDVSLDTPAILCVSEVLGDGRSSWSLAMASLSADSTLFVRQLFINLLFCVSYCYDAFSVSLP